VPSTARTVVVTGAGRGIGLATAVELALSGFDVVGTTRPGEDQADLRAEAAEAGVSVRVAELEVTDEASCRHLIDDERPWGLVNNAGFALAGAIVDVPDDEAREQLEVLVLGPARLGRLAARHMRDAGGGRIVNISSIAAELSSPLLGWYQAAKAALEGVSDAMRMELEREGIDVVLVQPGVIRTGIWADSREDLERPTRDATPAGTWQAVTRRLEPYMSSPEAVARVVRGALTEARPRDRYPVGLDAQVLTRVARVVPVPVTDLATRALLRFR
jgi:NAD(P)-dependent dehydrogenase (short-subunit alcohol dehydrogenase family)